MSVEHDEGTALVGFGERSAFARHRDAILREDRTGRWFQSVVLALWDGGADPVALSPLEDLGETDYGIFVSLIEQYRSHGETDEEFRRLAVEIQLRRANAERPPPAPGGSDEPKGRPRLLVFRSSPTGG